MPGSSSCLDCCANILHVGCVFNFWSVLRPTCGIWKLLTYISETRNRLPHHISFYLFPVMRTSSFCSWPSSCQMKIGRTLSQLKARPSEFQKCCRRNVFFYISQFSNNSFTHYWLIYLQSLLFMNLSVFLKFPFISTKLMSREREILKRPETILRQTQHTQDQKFLLSHPEVQILKSSWRYEPEIRRMRALDYFVQTDGQTESSLSSCRS